jgi:hypothetical protein
MVRREPIAGVDLDGLVTLLRPPVVVTGDLNAAAREALARAGERIIREGPVDAALPVGLEIASPAAATRRAGFLAELAWRRLAEAGGDDPATVEPIYLGA